jgi:hypothetical protein
VIPQADQIRRQLDRVISIRKSHRPLIEVLRDVGRQARCAVRIDSDAAATLPPQTRGNFSLLADNVTALEALEEIAAATGLAYDVEAAGIVFRLAGGTARTPAAGVSRRARDPYVAKILVPSPSGEYQIEFLIRESDLSPEARRLRQEMLEESSQVIEDALREWSQRKSRQES